MEEGRSSSGKKRMGKNILKFKIFVFVKTFCHLKIALFQSNENSTIVNLHDKSFTVKIVS